MQTYRVYGGLVPGHEVFDIRRWWGVVRGRCLTPHHHNIPGLRLVRAFGGVVDILRAMGRASAVLPRAMMMMTMKMIDTRPTRRGGLWNAPTLVLP